MDIVQRVENILAGPMKTNPLLRAVAEGAAAPRANPKDHQASIDYLIAFTEAQMAVLMAQGRALMELAEWARDSGLAV